MKVSVVPSCIYYIDDGDAKVEFRIACMNKIYKNSVSLMLDVMSYL